MTSIATARPGVPTVSRLARPFGVGLARLVADRHAPAVARERFAHARPIPRTPGDDGDLGGGTVTVPQVPSSGSGSRPTIRRRTMSAPGRPRGSIPAPRAIQGDRDRRGRGVADGLDVDDRVIDRDLQAIGHRDHDPSVRLVGDRQVDVLRAEARLLEQLAARAAISTTARLKTRDRSASRSHGRSRRPTRDSRPRRSRPRNHQDLRGASVGAEHRSEHPGLLRTPQHHGARTRHRTARTSRSRTMTREHPAPIPAPSRPGRTR